MTRFARFREGFTQRRDYKRFEDFLGTDTQRPPGKTQPNLQMRIDFVRCYPRATLVLLDYNMGP